VIRLLLDRLTEVREVRGERTIGNILIVSDVERGERHKKRERGVGDQEISGERKRGERGTAGQQ